MIRELCDIAWLEDFLSGLSRGHGFRFAVYDRNGGLVTASSAPQELPRRLGLIMKRLRPGLRLVRLLPADEPPAEIAFVEHDGFWHVVAPVYVDEQPGGFVGVGELREASCEPQQLRTFANGLGATIADVEALWQRLPLLERRGDSHAVDAARWAARMLSGWCQREARIADTTQELALVGDVAEMLHGEEELQTVLDRIVADTARVMKCRFCSLRLYDPATNELRIKAVHNLSREYVQKGPVYPDENSIDREALQGRMVYVEEASTDPRFRFPEEARREGIVSALTAGMIYRGRPVGVLRVYTDSRQRFRTAQRKLLQAIAYQAATAIVHAQQVDERLAAARTQRQIELAGDLQMRMMRAAPPRKPLVQTATIYQPSSHVGGDFCDIFLLADGRLTAVAADVVGKGVKASLLATYVRGALRAAAGRGDDLGDILTRLNDQLCRETLSSEFVTLLITAIDDDATRLVYCSAGHEPLLLLRGGEATALSEGGLVLGVYPGETYEQACVSIRPRDTILLYTDGAIEATNFEGALYGRDRLAESLRQHGGLELATALRSLQWDIRRFSGLAEQADDLTLVGLRVREEPLM